jgi:hypothetical protein
VFTFAALLLAETAAAPRGKSRQLAQGVAVGSPRLSSADFRDLEADFRSMTDHALRQQRLTRRYAKPAGAADRPVSGRERPSCS